MLVPLILGLISSLHCIGMCGPLALMVSGNNSAPNRFNKWLNPLLYNLGRVTTYAVLGLIFGIIGRSFAWFGWQQILSIVMGILILIFLFLPGPLKKRNFFSARVNLTMNTIRGRMGNLIFNGRPSSLYAFGILNGLLPCGMVYMAIAGAIASSTPLNGVLFMAIFGLGTLPAMWTISFFGTTMGQEFRMQFRKVFPAVMTIMAIILILRGLNLDIPYLSPSLHLSHSSSITCHD